MKNIFAVLGVFVLAMAVLGAFDVGHFRMYYGHDKHGCAKMEGILK